MNEETSNQKQQQQQQQQQQHVTSWPGKQVETLRLWEEAVKARKKGKKDEASSAQSMAREAFSSSMPSDQSKEVIAERVQLYGNIRCWEV